jgi:hypothetical protein
MFLRHALILMILALCSNIYSGTFHKKGLFTINPADIVIQIPSKHNDSIKVGAEELQKHLFLITGVKPPITSGANIESSKYLFHVGIKCPEDKRSLTREEARYIVTPEGTWLYGYDKLSRKSETALENVTDWVYSRVGTMFAVYNFLDRELNVRWPAPGDNNIIFVKQNPLSLKSDSHDWVPQLKVRLLWSTSYENWYYKRILEDKNIPQDFKLNPEQLKQKQLEEKLWQRRMRMGQSVVYSHSHAFTRWWNKYGKKHPEFFALNPYGKREPWRAGGAPSRICMCVSNPQLQKEIVRQWLSKRKHNKIWNETLNICENDGEGYCQCSECKKLDVQKPGEKFGEHMTDRYISFANNILKEARKKVPDAQVCMFAYMAYRFPPRKTRIDKDIVFSFVPKLWDSEEELNDLYAKWRQMGARKMLLRTNGMHVDIGLPMGFEKKIFRNFKVGVKNNIIGTRYDAIQSFWPSSGIVNYILARGFYSPEKDFEYWEKEYCDTYGAASGYVMEYYRYWRNNVWGKRIYPNRLKLVNEGDGFMRQALYWSRGKYYNEKDFDTTDSILEKASKCKLGELERKRLDKLVLANKHARKLYLAMKAGGQYVTAGANQKLCQENFDNIRELKKFRLENKNDLQFCWGRLMRHEDTFADGASTILGTLTDTYSPFCQLPEYWHYKQGELEGNIKTLDFKKWPEISINNYWQEKLKNYKGVVWYAVNLPDKKAFRNKKVYLVFGSVRGIAWIYVNGKLAMQGKKDWRAPFMLRIDEYINNNDNKLLIKVKDTGSASGIWRPVWIFTDL